MSFPAPCIVLQAASPIAQVVAKTSCVHEFIFEVAPEWS
jgi:hypothetical protein